jgi:hypothetical protein
MSKLWVPPSARPATPKSSDAFGDNRAWAHGEVDKQGFEDELTRQFDRHLYLIDPYLKMRRFPENTDVLGAVPGCYHLVRRAPDAPPTLISLSGPNGEFVEPVLSAILDRLAQGDLWNSRARRERERAIEETRAASERQKKREEEERHEHLKDAYAARFKTRVSMNRDVPWAQNVSGLKAVRRKKAA